MPIRSQVAGSRSGPDAIFLEMMTTSTNRIALFLLTESVIAALAQAEELPARQAAPVEYVRICDAYGDGFFYIPGTDACLRVGGLAMAEYRAFSVSYRMSNSIIGQPNSPTPFGVIPSPNQFGNPTGGSNTGFLALARVELDARTTTEWGVLRAFVRPESRFGSEGNAATGSLSGSENFVGANYNNNKAFYAPARETTILDKAFVQFAGLTAGRVQSFFDFYADAVNWQRLRGSNATVAALAYTHTFGGDLSGALSIEDNASRRDYIGSTIGNFNFGNIVGMPGFGLAYGGVPGGSRVPEIVGNLRLDRDWGAMQFSGAAHQLRTSLYSTGALAVTPVAYAFPVATSQDYGFAVQLGARFNLEKVGADIFSPGDKLWIQAAYENGATSYINGNNLNFSGGAVNGDVFYGFGDGGTSKAGNGWDVRIYDCVWTAFGHCDKSRGWVVLAALRHYWAPRLSSGFYGSFMALRYSGAALADVGAGVGAVDTDEYRIGSNLVWTPVENFDLGGEVIYLRDNHLTRPVGLAPDPVLNSIGLPSWKSRNGTIEGRVRVQRAF